MDIEARRLENLRQKQKLLADLNLEASSTLRSGKTKSETQPRDKPKVVKRKKLDFETLPVRKSSRVSNTRPNYNEDASDKYNYVEPKSKSRKPVSRSLKDENEEESISNDLRNLVPLANVEDVRAGWTKWTPTGPPAVRDNMGTFHFEDFPRFTPNKSPEEMLREGCFGGSYFRPLKSRRLGIVIEGDWTELPTEWHHGLDIEKYLASPDYDAEVNKFKVSCGQSIEEWEAAGWISFEHDIRGWFQWYCRFWMGRRCDDDERQVGRWDRCAGTKGRWRRLLLKKYVKMGVREVFDYGDEEDKGEVSPVMHQTCHHWAFEVRQHDLDEAWREFR